MKKVLIIIIAALVISAVVYAQYPINLAVWSKSFNTQITLTGQIDTVLRAISLNRYAVEGDSIFFYMNPDTISNVQGANRKIAFEYSEAIKVPGLASGQPEGMGWISLDDSLNYASTGFDVYSMRYTRSMDSLLLRWRTTADDTSGQDSTSTVSVEGFTRTTIVHQ